MNLDAELMFECLIYLNTFYFPVFATCESIMAIAKYRSIRDTPKIGQDASVVFSRLFAELLKIVLFRKLKDDRRTLATACSVILTLLSICGILYTFFIQDPVLKLEYILGAISIMLTCTEVVFGVLDLLPCCQKVQYY
ncbi:uncharacterized protein LOC109594566 [Aethina tumida]|uniref:uncharacterized protein LOC109594566 n=1 Tax=Aethina tumida TaxID=116153 RepID=UPI00096B5228|nr:uncharacterized protein LOC109594566 [Aethina tumida]